MLDIEKLRLTDAEVEVAIVNEANEPRSALDHRAIARAQFAKLAYGIVDYLRERMGHYHAEVGVAREADALEAGLRAAGEKHPGIPAAEGMTTADRTLGIVRKLAEFPEIWRCPNCLTDCMGKYCPRCGFRR